MLNVIQFTRNLTVSSCSRMVRCVLYLQKIFHDASLLVWLHCGYQALCKEVYHAALAHHEAILLMLTICKTNNENNGIHNTRTHTQSWPKVLGQFQKTLHRMPRRSAPSQHAMLISRNVCTIGMIGVAMNSGGGKEGISTANI